MKDKFIVEPPLKEVLSQKSEEVQEVMEQMPPWILRWGITVIAFILLGMIIGSYFFKYPDTLSAPIVITTLTPPVEITAHANGRLNTICVYDKQKVRSGDLLAVIANTAKYRDIENIHDMFLLWRKGQLNDNELYGYIQKSYFELGEVQSAFTTFKKALHAQILYRKQNYYPQKIALKTRHDCLQHRIDKDKDKEKTLHKEQFALSKKIYERDSILYKKNIRTGEEYDKMRQTYLQSGQNILNDDNSKKEMSMQHLQDEESILDLKQQHTQTQDQTILDLESCADQLENGIKAWEEAYIVKAPIDGYVNMMGIWSKNQNVTAGDLIMIIMPKDHSSSVGRAQMSAVGAGKVQLSQRVIVRLNNYPDGEFGFVEGRVSSISDIPNKDGNYIIGINFPHGLKTNYGKHLPQSKQTLGSAEIITKDKRLIENFIQPIEKLLSNQ